MRGDEGRVIRMDPRARHDQVGRPSVLDSDVRVGSFDDGRALGDGLRHPGAVAVGRRPLARRPVLEHRDVVARGARVRHHRGARRRQADHEDPHQSRTPGMRMKSA